MILTGKKVIFSPFLAASIFKSLLFDNEGSLNSQKLEVFHEKVIAY